MIERHIIIDSVDPVTFYGVNNANLHLIRNLFPKLRMAARGTVITVIGDEAETATFEQKIKELELYCNKYNVLPEDVIIDTIPAENHGVKLLSIGFVVDKEKAVLWRGAMASNALKQLITEGDWGELDYFIIDMPPGTSDIHLTLVQTY